MAWTHLEREIEEVEQAAWSARVQYLQPKHGSMRFKAAGRSKQSNKQIESGFDSFCWFESLQLSPFNNGFWSRPRQKWSFRGKVKLGDRSLGMVKLGCCKNDTLISNSEKQLSHLSWTVSPLQKEIELQISQIWSIQVHWSIASKKANSQGFNPAIWFCSLSQKNLMQEIWRLKQNWVKGFDAVYVFFFLMWTRTKRQAPVTVQMINLIRNQCFPCRHLASSWLLWRRSLPWGHGALATPTCTDTYP